jgi:hypothetical protein
VPTPLAAGTSTVRRWSPGRKSCSSGATFAGRPGVGRSAISRCFWSSHAQPPVSSANPSSGHSAARFTRAANSPRTGGLGGAGSAGGAETIRVMKSSHRAPAGAFFLAWAAASAAPCGAQPASGPTLAERVLGKGHPRIAVSPYTLHWRPSEEHTAVYALAAEWQREDRWLGGASLFRNSFGQPSAYVYVGQRITGLLPSRPEIFVQWSAGMLYGYRGKYENKVPLNNNGFAPGALASAGWAFDRRQSLTLHLLGDAGVMFQYSFDLR